MVRSGHHKIHQCGTGIRERYTEWSRFLPTRRQTFHQMQPDRMHRNNTHHIAMGDVQLSTVIVTLRSDPQFIGLRANLHPADTGCGSRCEEPSLHSISASVPWIGQRHVTIPISQSGDFPPTTSPDSTTDLVYRLHPKPVACFDLSVEFE